MERELSDLAVPVGWALSLYLVATYVLAFAVKRRVHDAEDFLVAGRRLPLSLAWATLLATWFGAGTMLTAADEVRAEGLSVIALEPLGSGLCLVVAGLFFARRLWDMKLLTLSDFFARRFGRRAELMSALIMVPGYFGWIAVQFLALASILELILGVPLAAGVALVAVVGMGYTLLGGMWAVTLTDALQLGLLLVGLCVLGVTVLLQLEAEGGGDALGHLAASVPAHMLEPVPLDDGGELVAWVGVLLVAMLGNIPGQDLLQRIFSTKSARVARQACIIAGVAYVGFGAIPVLLGLSANVLFPDAIDQAIVPALAHAFLTPAMAVIFTVALASAVLSTIDSAILSPSSVLAQNVFPRLVGSRLTPLGLNRAAVVLVTASSLVVAYVGEDAYDLLESAYEIGLMGLFVPLTVGLYRPPRAERPALWAMGLGIASWLLHLVAGWDDFLGVVPFPASLATVVVVLWAYLATDRGPGGA